MGENSISISISEDEIRREAERLYDAKLEECTEHNELVRQEMLKRMMELRNEHPDDTISFTVDETDEKISLEYVIQKNANKE